nr:hypothetical protein [Angustibacter aerolatus]
MFALQSAQQVVFLALGVLAFVVQVVALVDGLRRPAGAYVAAGKPDQAALGADPRRGDRDRVRLLPQQPAGVPEPDRVRGGRGLPRRRPARAAAGRRRGWPRITGTGWSVVSTGPAQRRPGPSPTSTALQEQQ